MIKTGNERFHALIQFHLHCFDQNMLFHFLPTVHFIFRKVSLRNSRFDEFTLARSSLFLNFIEEICEQGSTVFSCRRIFVIVHRSASDKLAVVHSSCLFGAKSYSGQSMSKREKVSGKVSNQRFVNSCLANSPSVYIYTVKRTL